MSHIVHEETAGKFRIVIRHDGLVGESPRNWCTLGAMICWHSRHALGDKHHHHAPYAFLCDLAEADEERDVSFDSLYKRIERKAVLLPLYLHDHSGITMNTTGFSCPWDSGQVGFIYVSMADVRKEYGVQRVSKKIRARVRDQLIAEVSSYDDYLRGNIYGYEIVKDDDVIDSCWGFLGDYEDHCLKEARRAVPTAA